MNKEQNLRFEFVGTLFGFTFSYLMFTTIFFFVLTKLGKLPYGWNYVNIMFAVALISGVGLLLKRYLK